MNANRLVQAGAAVLAMLASATVGMAADSSDAGSGKIEHVLLLSIDGMHAADFYNCSHGIAGGNGGDPCPNMAALSRTAINYVAASSSKPSDSFPGMAALVTGGSLHNSLLQHSALYRPRWADFREGGWPLLASACITLWPLN